MENKPPQLFKYVTLESGIKILNNLSLRFSNPKEFNDPFDCEVDNIDFDFSGEKNDDILKDMFQIEWFFRKTLPPIKNKDERNAFWANVYREAQKEKVKESRVCCFSLENDIVLLWSHYADSHKGICLGFNNLIEKRFIQLDETDDISEGIVDYSAETKINFIAVDKIMGVQKIFFSKSSSWQHEKEYRLVLLNKREEFHRFSSNFITDIYFGVNFPEDKINTIINLCKDKNLIDINFKKAKKENLKIYFEEIKNSR